MKKKIEFPLWKFCVMIIILILGTSICTTKIVSTGGAGSALPISKGGTGATTQVGAQNDLGVYSKSEVDAKIGASASTFTMQTFTSVSCENMATGGTIVLLDERNMQLYTIRKNPDNKCWMMDNLRIADITLNSQSSDVTSDYALPAIDNSSGSSNSVAQIGSYSGESPDHNSNDFTGYYYNFLAATAGWGTTSVSSGNSPQSICPKGWKLPTGGSGGDQQILYNSGTQSVNGFLSNWSDGRSTSSILLKRDFAGIRPGTNITVYSYYWSSTVANSDSAYNLRLSAVDILPKNNSSKYYGFSVRCVLR